MKKFIRTLFFVLFSLFLTSNNFAQCCAGGSGCPIAGGASQGVLQANQFEVNTNYQVINTDKFYTKSKPDTHKSFDRYSSQYEYFRVAYGVSKNLTMSVEGGYYFKKIEIGLNNNPLSTYQSKGIGDLILFPRYDVLNKFNDKTKTEIAIGLGYKIPLGSYNDSVGKVEHFSGDTLYLTKPTAVQLSSGAQDIIFHLFLFHGWTPQNFRVFANAIYIKKGWNPNGEKLGDYSSIAVFAGKSFFNHLGVTLQLRYEQVDTMKINENILMFGKPSTYEPDASGYKKAFLVPQLSYTNGNFTIYGSTEIPIYQFVNSNANYTQVGSKYLTTFGVSYRFYTKKPDLKTARIPGKYYCPMCPDVVSDTPGKCPKCKMDLEKAK